MKFYHNNIINDILIGLIGGVLIVGMIFGSAVQHQDRINAIAAMEVGE